MNGLPSFLYEGWSLNYLIIDINGLSNLKTLQDIFFVSCCSLKNLFALSLTFCGLLMLNSVFAQSTDLAYVNEHYTSRSLKEILPDLEGKYLIPLYYKNDWIPDTALSKQFENVPVLIAVQELLRGTSLSFAVLHQNSIIIAPESLLSREFSADYFINKERQLEYLNADNLPPNLEIINLGQGDNDNTTQGYQIAGVLTDELEGDTLSGASIMIKDLDMAVITNQKGSFLFTLSGGLHICEIRMVGYEVKTIGINVLNSTIWNPKILPEATELDEVLVSATADDSNVRSSIIGFTKLSPIELREMPSFLGEPDVIRSILTLPGISTIGEGATGFNVRGGNIDQNLIMQDNSLIFNSSHAMGFFSIFNPDAIKEVSLFKGHIPAQYGGRVSSVLDVKLKGNNYETFSGNGGIGLLASRITLEIPLIKEKTSLLLGGRIAYSDWVLGFVKNPDVKNSSLSFYDVNGKLSQKIGDNGSIALSFYRSYDKFDYSDQFGFAWDINTVSLTWDQVLNPGLFSEFSLSFSESSNASFQPSGIDAYNLSNGMNNYKLKEDILITTFEKHIMNTGFEVNAYMPSDETYKPFNSGSTVIPVDYTKDNGIETAVYFNDDIELTPLLSFSLGLRYSNYIQFGPSKVYQYENGFPSDPESIVDSTIYNDYEKVISYDGFDPRVSLRYSLTPSSSVKMSYNRIHQFIHLISNTTSALPIDYWQVSNTYFKPIISNNYSIGYFKNFRLNTWETSIEAYYRDMQNIIDYRDFPELFLNPNLETELLPGRGISYGLELYVKKKIGRFNGWLSYTFSRALVRIEGVNDRENVNNGDWFPSKFDQPHNLSVVGNINFNKTNQLSFNFTYSTGRPLTAPDANYGLEDYFIPNYSERNRYRLPANHRLDVSYTIQRGIFRTYKFKDSITFSIYNLYARKNAYSVFFKRNRSNVFGAYKLSILGTMLPSITYNFNF
jgi:hypothetical protein